MVAAVNPFFGGAFRGRIVSIEPQTGSASTIRFETNRPSGGRRAGQFVTIGVEVDGVRHHRCYSLTSIPSDDVLEITVQAIDDGTVSWHLVHHARLGDIVQLGEPGGDFTLPDEHVPMLCLTGGSGITPVMAMLRELDRRTPSRDASDVIVVHHVTTRDRLIFAAELAELDHRCEWLTVRLVVMDEGGRHLDPEQLDQYCPDWRDREVFVCGPLALREAALDICVTSGDVSKVHVESFTPLSRATSRPTSPTETILGSVLLSRSCREIEVAPGSTLLDALEAHGMAPPSGCRMGICHTCVTALTSGCVTDVRDGRVIEAGTHVQLCVTTTVDHVTLDI